MKMRHKIFPSVMGKTQKELNIIFKKLKGIASTLHIDVADGKFVPNTSFWFSYKLSKNFSYNVHLMVQNPDPWIKQHADQFETIIFHPEPDKDIHKTIGLLRQKGKHVGIAIKPETTYSQIEEYLPLVDCVLVLTVHPGFYGASFLRTPLRKIALIKRHQPNIKIIVDGGMNPQTIKEALHAGADHFVCGSYISKSHNPKDAMQNLKDALK